MQSIKEVIASSLTNYKGSEVTRSLVEDQIKAKYGETELKNLDCYRNLRTYHSWSSLGYKVRAKEKAIKSFTFVETKDEAGNILKTYRHPISLFYYRQVEKVGSEA